MKLLLVKLAGAPLMVMTLVAMACSVAVANAADSTQTGPSTDVGIGGQAEAAQYVDGRAPNRLKANSANSEAVTTSNTFVDVPNAKLSVLARKGPIVITFSAECLALDNAGSVSAYVVVRTTVDGVPVPPFSANGLALCSTKDSVAESHSYTWVYDNPSPGKKIVNFQFRSEEFGDTSILDEYTFLVQYRKLSTLELDEGDDDD